MVFLLIETKCWDLTKSTLTPASESPSPTANKKSAIRPSKRLPCRKPKPLRHLERRRHRETREQLKRNAVSSYTQRSRQIRNKTFDTATAGLGKGVAKKCWKNWIRNRCARRLRICGALCLIWVLKRKAMPCLSSSSRS